LQAIRRFGLELFVGLVLVIGTPNAGRATDQGPILSFFRPNGLGVAWLFWRADQDKEVTFRELATPAHLIFWEEKQSGVLYALGNTVFRAALNPIGAPAERAATLPNADGDVRALWRERGTRRLRIIAMQKIEPANVLVENGVTRYRLPDGTIIKGLSEPDWGTPFACSVLELQDDGAWKLIARRPTKDEAGDTPGISVVDDLRHELGASNRTLLASYTCDAGQCRNDVPAELVARAAADVGRKLTDDDLSLLKLGGGKPSLLFGTVMGDQLHMVPPVMMISEEGATIARLPANGRRQIGLGVDQDLLLLADERTGDRPLVAALRTGKIRFSAPDAATAAWIPR
jgi:hypothetical protein